MWSRHTKIYALIFPFYWTKALVRIQVMHQHASFSQGELDELGIWNSSLHESYVCPVTQAVFWTQSLHLNWYLAKKNPWTASRTAGFHDKQIVTQNITICLVQLSSKTNATNSLVTEYCQRANRHWLKITWKYKFSKLREFGYGRLLKNSLRHINSNSNTFINYSSSGMQKSNLRLSDTNRQRLPFYIIYLSPSISAQSSALACKGPKKAYVWSVRRTYSWCRGPI